MLESNNWLKLNNYIKKISNPIENMSNKSIPWMIKERIMKNTPVGVVAWLVWLAKDKIAQKKSEHWLDVMKQKKAKRLSPTWEMRREWWEWVPYSYWKNIK
jgi:hypothetical protein